MRFAFGLVVYLAAALGVVRGVELYVPPPEAPAETPLFANGKDVFGRGPSCRACHHMLNFVNMKLLPELEALQKKEERRKLGKDAASRRTDYGIFETVIDDAVTNACKFNEIWQDKQLRVSCLKIMEDHEDDISAAYYRWLKRGGRKDESWSWNWEVCYKATDGACSEELAMHHLEEFADDGSGASERKYRSEQEPPKGHRTEGLYTVVAANFHQAMVVEDKVDSLAYFAYPKKDQTYHWSLMPALQEVQKLWDRNETLKGTFKVGMVDSEMNDVPPPYGTNSKEPLLAMYPAGNKGWPRYITDMNNGELTVYDVLFFIRNTASINTAVAAAKFMAELPESQLTFKPWENDEL